MPREDDFSTKINELSEKPENQDKKTPPEGQHETGRNPKNARRGPSGGAGKGYREGGFTENGEKLSKMLGGDSEQGSERTPIPHDTGQRFSMIHVLLTGTLYDTPVGRIARNGNPFATAKLLADVGDGSAVWCSMIAFAEAGERLATLHAGDAVSVAGKARLSQWEDAEGKPQAGLDVTVTEVISLQSASRAGFRRPRTVQPDQAEAESASETAIPFDDDLDFLGAGPAKADAEGVLVGSERGPFPAATTGTVGGEATEKPKNGLQRGGATRAAVLKTPAKAPRKARKRRKLLQAPSPSPKN